MPAPFRHRFIAVVAGALALAVAAAGCAGDGGSDPSDADAGPTFIAFAGDFAPYQTWTSFSYDGGGNSVHDSGPRTEYINHLPPPGSTAFPVGTIIVKDIVSQRPNLFAMVKRGGGYNPNGASGWEWYDLVVNDNAPPTIHWSGVAPPSGESYGGDPTACNVCHSAETDNDSVLSPKIRLSGF